MARLTRLISNVVAWVTGETPQFCGAVLDTYVYFLAKGYTMQNCMFLAKQIAHETGWGTSNSISLDNNPWGMNCVSTRETTQTGCRETPSGEVLGVYPNCWHSVRDRYLWDNYWGIDSHKASTRYPEAVGERYHTSSGYIPAVMAVDESRIRRVMTWSMVVTPVEAFAVLGIIRRITS